MWEQFTVKRAWAKTVLSDAEKGKKKYKATGKRSRHSSKS